MKEVTTERMGDTTICAETDRAHIDVTNICNNFCVFCLRGKDWEFVHRSLQDIKDELDVIGQHKVKKLVIAGGEPSIYPYIIDVVKHAKSLGIPVVQMITNGRMYSYKKFTKDIIEAGLDEITFSVHGHNTEMHDYLVAAKGAWVQLKQGINNVLPYKDVIVSADIGMFKPNYEHLEEITHVMVNELGLKRDFNFIGISLQGNALSNMDKMLAPYSQVGPHLCKALKIIDDNNLVAWVLRCPLRFMPGYEKYREDSPKLAEEMITLQDVFKDEVPHCKGVKCPYCRQQNICPEFLRLRKKFKEGGVQNITVELGVCNNACPSCSKIFKERSIDQFKQDIDKAATFGIDGLEIRGETNRILEIVKYAKQKFNRVSIITNGKVFNNLDLAKEIAPLLDHITLTLFGPNDEIHDEITNSQGSFDEARRALGFLSSSDVKTTLNIIVHKKNYEMLNAYMPLIRKAKLHKIRLQFINPHGTFRRNTTLEYGNNVEDQFDLLPLYSEVTPKVKDFISKYKDQYTIAVKDLPQCIMQGFENHVEEDFPPLRLDFFRGHTLNPVEFTKHFIRRTKEKMQFCVSCKHKNNCGGFFEKYLKIHTGNDIVELATPVEEKESMIEVQQVQERASI